MSFVQNLSPVKQAAKALGIDIRSRRHLFESRFVQHTNRLKLDLIVDVGANKGQFAESILGAGYKGVIISFEPQPDACEILIEKAKRWGDRWIIAPPMAIAEKNGTTEFTCFSANAMSSLLEPVSGIEGIVPHATVEKTITVKLEKLEDILWDIANISPQPFALKIDTQGSELRVLQGAEKLFQYSRLVQFESSLKPIYQDQPSYFELDLYMRNNEFTIVDLEPGYRHNESGVLIEYDVIYETI